MGKKRTKEEWSAIMAKYHETQDYLKKSRTDSANRFGKEHLYEHNRYPLRNREPVPKGHFIHNPKGATSAGALRLAKIYNQKASTFRNKQQLAQLDYNKSVDQKHEFWFENPEYKKLEEQYDKIDYGNPEKQQIRKKMDILRLELDKKNNKVKEEKAKAGRQFSIYQTHSINNQEKVDDILRAKSRYDNYPDKGFSESDMNKVKGFIGNKVSRKTDNAQPKIREYYAKNNENHERHERELEELKRKRQTSKPKHKYITQDPEYIAINKRYNDTLKQLEKKYNHKQYSKNLDKEQKIRKEIGFS